jgi:hypothetical protein
VTLNGHDPMASASESALQQQLKAFHQLRRRDRGGLSIRLVEAKCSKQVPHEQGDGLSHLDCVRHVAPHAP